jgi:hypothetical protein
MDDQHRYWIPGPKRVPGFTEICTDLGVIPPNPFYTAEGRDRGTALHVWLQFLIAGKRPSAPPDERIAERVKGIEKFILNSGFRPIGGEEPRYDPVSGVACTPDLWGFIGNWSYVIDLKSGAAQDYHPLQTACQQIALNANGFRAQKRAALYIRGKSPRLVLHSDNMDRTKWLFHVHQYRTKHKATA